MLKLSQDGDLCRTSTAQHGACMSFLSCSQQRRSDAANEPPGLQRHAHALQWHCSAPPDLPPYPSCHRKGLIRWQLTHCGAVQYKDVYISYVGAEVWLTHNACAAAYPGSTRCALPCSGWRAAPRQRHTHHLRSKTSRHTGGGIAASQFRRRHAWWSPEQPAQHSVTLFNTKRG